MKLHMFIVSNMTDLFPCDQQLGGIAVLVIGVWTLMDKAFIEVLLRNNLYMSAAYIMIIAGTLSTCLSLLGFIAALKVTSVTRQMYLV